MTDPLLHRRVRLLFPQVLFGGIHPAGSEYIVIGEFTDTEGVERVNLRAVNGKERGISHLKKTNVEPIEEQQ